MWSQKFEATDLGTGCSGVQQCTDLIRQHMEEAEVKENIELMKCNAILKMIMAAVSRQKNISTVVKTGLHSLEELLEVIEANLSICRNVDKLFK